LYAANQSNTELRRAALEQLLTAYLPVLESYLVRQRNLCLDDARDILHAFISDKVLAGSILSSADRQRGRFRNLILKALNNYLISEMRKKNRQPVCRMGITPLEAEQVPAISHENFFDAYWARQVVENALAVMRTECTEKSRTDVWRLFEIRVVFPAYHGRPPISYKDIVHQLGIGSPREAINLLVTAKRMFVRALRTEVGRYTPEEVEIEREIDNLRHIIANSDR
jgi:DNA-directed RNA polymerase specialized sigma24 family protein